MDFVDLSPLPSSPPGPSCLGTRKGWEQVVGGGGIKVDVGVVPTQRLAAHSLGCWGGVGCYD